MQRTVKQTRYTYAKTELNENNELFATLETVTVNETEPKKALKMAFAQVGTFAPLKVETTETLYKLDDEIFFKYAVPVDNTNV